MANHRFMPYWVVKAPTSSPVVPVIAPAERSNSPPIMSMATATAMMPNNDAEYSQVAVPAGDRNAFVASEK